MPNRRNYRNLAALAVVLSGTTAPLIAQDQPWIGFTDVVTGLSCEVVHTDNLELVVSLDPTTGIENLVIVTGGDVRLFDTELLPSNDILFLGEPAGSIIFADGANGIRALWWVGFGDSVVNVDRFTGEPVPTELRPGDIVVSTCDGCDLWDDPNVCVIIDDDPVIDPPPPPLTINICGTSMAMAMGLTFIGLMGTGLARRRFVSRNSAAIRGHKEREQEA